MGAGGRRERRYDGLDCDVPADSNRAPASAWSDLGWKCGLLWPFLWPKGDVCLQVRIGFCVALLLAVRVVNVAVPFLNKEIIDALGLALSGDNATDHRHGNSTEESSSSFWPASVPWALIAAFMGCKFLQGGAGGGAAGGGFLNNVRTLLWVRVQQFTARQIRMALFGHLHSLSVGWHHSRKTGEVLRVMDRGAASVTSLLQHVFFTVVPTAIDIVVAVAYLSAGLNAVFGAILVASMALYLVVTVAVTEWRTKFRRAMNAADNEQRARSVDSLLNAETVKYFNNEEYESDRFMSATLDYQRKAWVSMASMNLLDFLQNVVITSGFLAGYLLCAKMVADTNLTVGDYVFFGTYMTQLLGPLNALGQLYWKIQESLVNMENMFELFHEVPEVRNASSDVPRLKVERASVEFRNVSFGYDDKRPVLRNVSFFVDAGQTLAVVGPSGAGKSTLISLIFRLFDPTCGQVLIDGQDIKLVDLDSVRAAIGVVPQDTNLFNDTVFHNIQYGRVSSDLASVVEASRQADLHSRVVSSLASGYDTRVGERGVKLSGGERQRVAIARTLLKAPAVVLLDEATSALDSHTERNVQDALAAVTKNRTTVVVAHRLSTVCHADRILVLSDGAVAEAGTHDELLARAGIYAGMWNAQAKTSNANVEDDGNQSSRRGEIRLRNGKAKGMDVVL